MFVIQSGSGWPKICMPKVLSQLLTSFVFSCSSKTNVEEHCSRHTLPIKLVSTQSHLFLSFFFYIADITPPTLTFRRRPFYSNANITIEWSYDEEASSHCTLQTPTLLLPVNCNQSVTLQNLAEGLHSLFIQGTDLAGNSVTVRHTWSGGKRHQ